MELSPSSSTVAETEAQQQLRNTILLPRKTITPCAPKKRERFNLIKWNGLYIWNVI